MPGRAELDSEPAHPGWRALTPLGTGKGHHAGGGWRLGWPWQLSDLEARTVGAVEKGLVPEREIEREREREREMRERESTERRSSSLSKTSTGPVWRRRLPRSLLSRPLFSPLKLP